MLELTSVGKTYAQRKQKIPVLQEVNLQVQKGDFIIIIGESGSGKTTLLNIVAALDTPSEGSVSFQKKDIHTLNDEKASHFRNQKIGYDLSGVLSG